MNQPHPSPVTLLKKKPLSLLLGVSSRTIDTWVAQRFIPYLAPSPRLHLFDPAAVMSALAARFGVQPRTTA
ncbi:MAG: hypothetical protein ACKVY0_09000 [Prosthecobacter sp.]|uniref:hypothetical protein n=1 Tax=Prosthecobacter sp. TaxID=1965333 RepID=UPI0038FE51DF